MKSTSKQQQKVIERKLRAAKKYLAGRALQYATADETLKPGYLAARFADLWEQQKRASVIVLPKGKRA